MTLENADDLERELSWFAKVVEARFKLYFDSETKAAELPTLTPPELGESPYASFVQHYKLTFLERLAIVLSLVPALRPHLLDVFFTRNQLFDRRFTEFGGVQGSRGDFLPTGETLAFLIAGTDLRGRFAVQSLLDADHFFVHHNILRPMPIADEPPICAPLRLSEEYFACFTTGRRNRSGLGEGFPARLITTDLGWDDVVLHPNTRRQIDEIAVWLQHGQTLMKDWGMARKLRPGYRSLFYGPPGTGKTITACLLGQAFRRDVYKVDLSLIVSKYIGETEKNLGRVFDHAQSKDWLLFFDEADALFGKRSETRDSHDRYANQEVSFLLQRIESFDGVAILASNRRENLDEAFARRFESIIYFPMPRPEDRLSLWRRGFSPQAPPEPSLDLERLAKEYTLSGGAIMNVIRYASLQALRRGDSQIAGSDVLQGIRYEHAKEGKGN